MKLTSELDKLKTEVKNLSTQVDDLAQYSRKNCLRFSGIAESSSVGREDTDKIVLNICNKVILRSIGTTLDFGDIDNSHRLGPKPRSSHDPPRDIIVKFTRYRSKAVVYGNKRNLKNYNSNHSSGYKVFINEALTKRRANVFSRLRRCKRDGLIDSCWTYEGKLFVKKSLGGSKTLIRDEDDVALIEHTGHTGRERNSNRDDDIADTLETSDV
jgi:hypothetical protein